MSSTIGEDTGGGCLEENDQVSTPCPTKKIESETITIRRSTDVIFGRGNGIAGWKGNMLFRRIIWNNRDVYKSAGRYSKVKVASKIYDMITKDLRPPGRFLIAVCKRTEEGTDAVSYQRVDMKRAIEKICQALRERSMTGPPKTIDDFVTMHVPSSVTTSIETSPKHSSNRGSYSSMKGSSKQLNEDKKLKCYRKSKRHKTGVRSLSSAFEEEAIAWRNDDTKTSRAPPIITPTTTGRKIRKVKVVNYASKRTYKSKISAGQSKTSGAINLCPPLSYDEALENRNFLQALIIPERLSPKKKSTRVVRKQKAAPIAHMEPYPSTPQAHPSEDDYYYGLNQGENVTLDEALTLFDDDHTLIQDDDEQETPAQLGQGLSKQSNGTINFSTQSYPATAYERQYPKKEPRMNRHNTNKVVPIENAPIQTTFRQDRSAHNLVEVSEEKTSGFAPYSISNMNPSYACQHQNYPWQYQQEVTYSAANFARDCYMLGHYTPQQLSNDAYLHRQEIEPDIRRRGRYHANAYGGGADEFSQSMDLQVRNHQQV